MSEVLTQDAISDDAFLGDALRVLQPRIGYRAGLDAVLLAATIAERGEAFRVLDAGAGVGVVGLCVARRIADAEVVLVEREPALADLALQNAERNGLAGRVSVVRGDVTGKADKLNQVPAEAFDVVLANPPFHAAGHGTASDKPLKAASHAMGGDELDAWVRFAARVARPGGTLTTIHKADAITDLLDAFGRRFGAIRVKPVYARVGEPAIRVIVSGIKGSRGRPEIRPPIVLHGDGHGFTPELSAILREGAPLAM